LSLLATALVVLFIFIIQSVTPQAVDFILAASGLTGFIAWLGIAISHYRFRKAYVAQGYDTKQLIYKAKWFPFGPIFAFILCLLVIIGQDSKMIFEGIFEWKGIFITYMGIPFFLFFYFFHKIKHKTTLIPLKDVDLTK